MCQATVYLGDREVAREVIGLDLAEDGVRLMTFFEAPQLVRGRIQHIDFLKHRVQLEPMEEGQHGRD